MSCHTMALPQAPRRRVDRDIPVGTLVDTPAGTPVDRQVDTLAAWQLDMAAGKDSIAPAGNQPPPSQAEQGKTPAVCPPLDLAGRRSAGSSAAQGIATFPVARFATA